MDISKYIAGMKALVGKEQASEIMEFILGIVNGAENEQLGGLFKKVTHDENGKDVVQIMYLKTPVSNINILDTEKMTLQDKTDMLEQLTQSSENQGDTGEGGNLDVLTLGE